MCYRIMCIYIHMYTYICNSYIKVLHIVLEMKFFSKTKNVLLSFLFMETYTCHLILLGRGQRQGLNSVLSVLKAFTRRGQLGLEKAGGNK